MSERAVISKSATGYRRPETSRSHKFAAGAASRAGRRERIIGYRT
jgi:hypothetical protein